MVVVAAVAVVVLQLFGAVPLQLAVTHAAATQVAADAAAVAQSSECQTAAFYVSCSAVAARQLAVAKQHQAAEHLSQYVVHQHLCVAHLSQYAELQLQAVALHVHHHAEHQLQLAEHLHLLAVAKQ